MEIVLYRLHPQEFLFIMFVIKEVHKVYVRYLPCNLNVVTILCVRVTG
jgi:hypothetical protein